MRTRNRLLDAAQQVFSQIGYKEATILDVTEAADVSKRTFYLHFDDKEDLIEALALRELQSLRDHIENSKEHTHDLVGSQREDFKHVVLSIYEYAASNPDLMQIIFGEDGSYRLQAMTHEFTARAWDENFRQHCEWQPDAPVPRDVLAHAIAGTIHQILSWWVRVPNDYTAEQMADMCMSVLFDGMDVNMKVDQCVDEVNQEVLQEPDSITG
jgi:AcrR family transcriptional regulator